MNKKKATGFYLAIVTFIFLLAIAYMSLPATYHSYEIDGYKPVKNDARAQKHVPSIIPGQEFGKPYKVYYRMSKDDEGNTHIAYHFVWPYERNDNDGFMPMMSRWFYTGGLKFQRVMFGKEDVEVVGIQLSPAGQVVEVKYEEPDNYDPEAFTVKHKDVTIEKDIPQQLIFKVVSWNHLFNIVRGDTLTDEEKSSIITLEPEYFTNQLWEEYTMFKERETPFKKQRAHFKWERESVEGPPESKL